LIDDIYTSEFSRIKVMQPAGNSIYVSSKHISVYHYIPPINVEISQLGNVQDPIVYK